MPSLQLPKTDVFNFHGDARIFEAAKMEFRLTWKGGLPSSSGDGSHRTFARAADKQTLRKHFHKQIRNLWKEHGNLRQLSESRFLVTEEVSAGMYPNSRLSVIPTTEPEAQTWLEYIASNYQRLGTRFVPLIRRQRGLTCSLDILFLRRDAPGSVLDNKGDIDNRVKTLIDGLTMPGELQQLGGLVIEADENPFYCLLEDDRLMTGLSVTTDRLLTPITENETSDQVEATIRVVVNDDSAIFAGQRLI